ncbi:hypothetical protein [Aquimarina muelleri]|uniref:Uncharacterized protein n=1 Tax=Aquimarina muelleri TaxID=279356 RepID=A0A918JXZ3_9FLAO|nr:hypothetical protein [Aquimarina muelleri]MCX2763682.1 hypothetical protein [Aquimarina muelleri]GGX30304.1 hypothetical protein GCM10007384_34270 [Aquimarina muelleri]
MSSKTTIAGIHLTLNFCKKINEIPISLKYISNEPVVNIYKSINRKSYVVNIMSYIPLNPKSLSEIPLESGLYLDEEKKLFLSYTGVNNIDTAITNSKNNGTLLCRVFNIVYDHDNTVHDHYNLYHIQFEYKLLAEKFQSVEGIIIHDINLDPETDRGTVTTVRVDDQ